MKLLTFLEHLDSWCIAKPRQILEEMELGDEKAYVWLGHFIKYLMCISGENRVAHTSHTLPRPKNREDGGVDIYRQNFSPGLCLKPGLMAYPLVPVPDTNRD